MDGDSETIVIAYLCVNSDTKVEDIDKILEIVEE